MLRVGGGCRLAKFNVGGGGRLPIGGSIPKGGGGGGGAGTADGFSSSSSSSSEDQSTYPAQ